MEIEKKSEKKISKLFGKQPCIVIYTFCTLIMFVPMSVAIIIPSFLSGETSSFLFNLISLTLGFGVFVIIGVLLYYAERKWHLKDLIRSTIEYKSGGVEITEKIVRMRNMFLVIWIPFLILMAFASIGAGIIYEFIQALLVISIIWIILIPTTIWIYLKLARGTTEPRMFFISDKIIKFLVPPRPLFQVEWSNIDKIEVKLQPYLAVHYKGLKNYINIHELNFIGKNYHQTFEIFKGRDFGFKFMEIFNLIQKYAIKMNKEFYQFY